MKPGFIYIVTNKYNNTYYIGITSDLPIRILEHIEKRYENSFSARYNLNKLVYYEQSASPVRKSSGQMIGDAIAREKQLKAGSRKNKISLIENMNPQWLDLYEEIKDIMII